MIDPKEPKRIMFHHEDQPEVPEIDQQAIDAERMERQRKAEENRLWLHEHMGFDPFGDDW